MSTRSRRTAVSLALLLGMAYGLGAAPCGCWEHSGWRAAAVLLSESPEHPPADVDRLIEDECHGQVGSTAMLVERHRIGDPGSELTAIDGPAWDGSSVIERAACAVDRRDAVRPALPVRAELQVYRL